MGQSVKSEPPDPGAGEADESGKAGKSVLFDGSEKIPGLKLTAKAPENGWLEDFLVSFWGVSADFQGQTCC